MTTCLEKSRSFSLLCVYFVNVYEFVRVLLSLLFLGSDVGEEPNKLYCFRSDCIMFMYTTIL